MLRQETLLLPGLVCLSVYTQPRPADPSVTVRKTCRWEEAVESKEWTVKDLMEALKRFPPEAKIYYEMGPNGPGTIGKAQYVKVWGDDEMGVLLDR